MQTVIEKRGNSIGDYSPGSEFSTNADFALVNRLLQNPRYNIPERLRDKMISRIEKVIDENTDDDTALRAINVAVNMDRNNIKLVELSIPKKVENISVKKMSDEELSEALRELTESVNRNKVPVIG